MMSVRAARVLRLAAAAGAGALLAGGLSGPGAAAEGTRDAGLAVSYQCAFPAGPQQVGVRYQAAFPASVPPGGQVRPERVAATLTVPRSALAGLDAAKIAGTVQVSARTGQDGETAEAGWPALTVEPAAVPDEGPLILEAAGDVPAVTAGRAGDLTFSVGDLGLVLAPAEDAEGGGTPAGQVACTPEQGQNQVLATVPLTSGESEKTPEKPKAVVPAGEAPQDCKILHDDGWQFSGCVYMNGFSNVRKLDGATVLNDPASPRPALTNVQFNFILGLPGGTGADVRFKFHEPLRSRASFLTFGFMPTTATMQIDQHGLGKQVITPYKTDHGTRFHLKTEMRVSIRLSDVVVNGTPLDVGDRCQSAEQVGIELSDAPGAEVTSVLKGGTSQGTFQIPPFQGCGVGEDLDPLFTGSVSGPGNDLKINQGPFCALAPATCPPAMPELKR